MPYRSILCYNDGKIARRGIFVKGECLICKAPLGYLNAGEMMECAICHKKEPSKTRYVKGYYICNEYHTAGMDTIIGLCLNETSTNPMDILEKMMARPFCHMYGPERHVMVGSALLAAYKNAGGDIDPKIRLKNQRILSGTFGAVCYGNNCFSDLSAPIPLSAPGVVWVGVWVCFFTDASATQEGR